MVGGTGGTQSARSCPNNAVMTGIRARVGQLVDAVGIRCRTIAASGTLGAESNAGSMMGGTGGTEREKSCPTGTVVAGQKLGRLGPAIVSIGLLCRGWNASTRSTSGSTAVAYIATSQFVISGGILKDPENLIAEQSTSCPSSQRPVRTIRARTGLVVDAMGLTCSAP